jgi:YVTN family beta-propeller protein
MKSITARRIMVFIITLAMVFPQFVFAVGGLDKLDNTVVLYLGSSRALVNNVDKMIDSSNSSIVPVSESGRTLVPVRFVSESMGMSVVWDNATKGITITQGSDIVKMQIDNKNMSKNDVPFSTDVAPCSKNGRTYVPLRILSESFGKNVFFDRNIIIISEKTKVFDKVVDRQIVDTLLQRFQTNPKLSIEEISTRDKSVVIINSLDKDGEVISQGSGFCIAQGIFATNYHVIDGAGKLQVETEDGKKYEVEGIVSADLLSDLALLKTKLNPNIPALKLGFDKQKTKGQQIVTIGSPEGLKNTVSEGIISGFRSNLGVDLIQISAPITHGSSGSPLFDMYGDVIGINTSGLDAGNLNFAVSINHINDWYKRISGLSFASIPIIGRESFTKDSQITDSEITRTLIDVSMAFNAKNISDYMDMFIYNNDVAKNADLETAQYIFKEYDIKMVIASPKIIKKTTGETLVRATVSYIESSKDNYYRDSKIESLFYLRKVGTQLKVFRVDGEKITYLEGIPNIPGSTIGTAPNTETPVVVVTPDNITGTKLPVSSPGINPPTGSTGTGTNEINVSMAINSYKYNKSNNKIYAVNTANKKLIVIDAGTKKIEKTVGLKYKPSDLCVSTDNKYLYIVNEGSNNILEISLSDYSVKREFLWEAETYGRIPYHFHIEYYKNKLYIVDAKWAPSLWVLDLGSMDIIDFGQNANSNKIATDKIDNVGDLVIDNENGNLYFWQQYGWDAGYAASDVFRYEVGDTDVEQMDKAGLKYPSFGRDPLDTPIMIVKQKNLLVCKKYVLNMNNLSQKYYEFDEDLYAVDNNGKYAVSKKSIYELENFDKIGSVPVQDADFYFFDSANTLYMVDNKSSKIKYYNIK